MRAQPPAASEPEACCPDETWLFLAAYAPDDGLPSLALVDVDELVEIVADRGDLSHESAARAVRRGVLCAGYTPESRHITTADAFDVVEEALRFHVRRG
ncbi:hypothetical protein [Aeromicrobium sp. LTX1]|uniref:hypothetical protein n=1 Tax=Aeromicrobium sp. LTX1 TaxID=3389798 RepID=UPI00396B215B